MEFSWINLVGAAIVVLILIPNIIYVFKNKAAIQSPTNAIMVMMEQVGRYACIVLMWLPLVVWKFGFRRVDEMLFYIGGNIILLVLYYIFWSFYYKSPKRLTTIALAILPSCIFLLSCLLLRHWLLVISAVLFGIGHIYITAKSNFSI